MKRIYQIPSIKVVSFKVEDAFFSPGPETTNLNIGDENYITTEHPSGLQGSETFFQRSL